MLHCGLPWKQSVPGTSFPIPGWRALESNSRHKIPALWKAFVQQLQLEGLEVDLAPLLTAGADKQINLCLMGKAAVRKGAQTGEGKPCFQVCQAHVQNSNWGCLRQPEGEEGVGDEGMKGHVKKSHQTHFLRPTDALGFHINQQI